MVSRAKFRGSLKWAYLMTWLRRVMTAAVTLILAAVLGPKQFGLVMIATIYIALLTVMVEQGLRTAIVQREVLEPEHLDSAFWMNIVWCLLLTGLAIGTSWWWADLNNAPAVQPMVAALSVILILRGIVQVQVAILEREMKFKLLGIRSNAATFAGGVVGIGLAFGGAGAWALVAQMITFDAVSLFTLYAVGDWRPRFRFSTKHAFELLRFSTSVFVANLATWFYRRSDALLLGLFCLPQVVGIYRLCDRLVTLTLEVTMQPISLASLPYFSRLQNDAVELRRGVAWCIRLAITIAVPVLLLLAACGPWLLDAIGEEWAPGGTALKLLCVAGIAKSMINFVGPLLFAVDRPRIRAATMWGLAAIGVGSVVIVGSAVSDASGDTQLLAMSLSRAVVFVAIVIPINLYVVYRVTGFSPRQMLSWLPAPLASGAAALLVGGAFEVTGVLDPLSPRIAVFIVGTLATLATVGVLVALDEKVRRYAIRRLSSRPRRLRGARTAEQDAGTAA